MTGSSIGAAMLTVARRAAAAARAVIGVPDYARYVRHVRDRHPGQEPMTRQAFERDALARRYERPGSRCC
jgi:uncharacterized short protein YbdD (DUF466 family)